MDESISEMKLRDWFAGQALIGIVAASKSGPLKGDVVSEWAYDIAKAMMVEREK